MWPVGHNYSHKSMLCPGYRTCRPAVVAAGFVWQWCRLYYTYITPTEICLYSGREHTCPPVHPEVFQFIDHCKAIVWQTTSGPYFSVSWYRPHHLFLHPPMPWCTKVSGPYPKQQVWFIRVVLVHIQINKCGSCVWFWSTYKAKRVVHACGSGPHTKQQMWFIRVVLVHIQSNTCGARFTNPWVVSK